MDMNTRIAALAYDAYGETTDHKNFRGEPMPAWEELPGKIQDAWRAAVYAAVVKGVDLLLADHKPAS